MNVIFEGPDNSGKSTLVRAVAEAIEWPIKSKEGKPATFDATIEKIKFYLTLDRAIIDRHPIISQSVYGCTVREDPPIPQVLMDRFLLQNHLIVYCRCLKLGMRGHEPSPTDTPEHLARLETRRATIIDAYDSIMIRHASIIYTDWDQTDRVIAMIKGVIASERQRH